MEAIEANARKGPAAAAGPLRVWEHGGRLYADGLFKLADQEGFSLADAVSECRPRWRMW